MKQLFKNLLTKLISIIRVHKITSKLMEEISFVPPRDCIQKHQERRCTDK